MLSLLAPAALAGALLLAIPVAIHLFKPRKVRVTAFSSLRWLNLSKQKLARRIQWHQLLLFLVRAAFILLLVFALSRPLFTPGGKTVGVDRFVILDVSRSMGYTDAEQPTPLDRAKKVAADLLTHSKSDDRVALVLTAGRSHAMGPLVHDGQTYLTRLSAIKPTEGQTDLSSALDTITPMLPPVGENRAVQIYYLTDDHIQSWNQGVIKQFNDSAKRPISVHLVDVSSPNAQNAYITQVKRLVVPGPPSHQSLSVSVGYSGAEKAHRKVQLDGIKGLSPQNREITLEPGQTQWVQFELPPGLDVRDQIARFTLDPADGLASDDTAYLHLDNLGATQLLVITNAPAPNQDRSQDLHLLSAIQALHQTNQNHMEITRRTPDKLTVTDIEQAQAIIMADVPSLSTDQLDALRHRVQMGAGLAIFLGPSINLSFYNNGLYNPLNPSQGLIPWKLGNLKQATLSRGELPGLTDVLWSHPLLQPLYDPILGDLPQTRFFQFFDITPLIAEGRSTTPASTQPGSDPNTVATNSPPRVLAKIDDQAPMLIENPDGAGKVLLFNTTANDAWSDLPRRKSFVPLVDHLINYLAGGQAKRRFEVLTPITIMLPQQAGQGPYAVHQVQSAVTDKAPMAGQTYTTTSQKLGVRTLVRLNSVAQPGVYDIQDAAGKTITNFVAFPGLGDSRITSIDTQILRQWWEPAAFVASTPQDAVSQLVATTATVRLWPWLIALGGLLLIIEMYLVHRLCPRMNPKLAQSVLENQKSILQPLQPASSRSAS